MKQLMIWMIMGKLAWEGMALSICRYTEVSILFWNIRTTALQNSSGWEAVRACELGGVCRFST